MHLENALERLREELEEEWRRKCGYGPVGGEQSDQTTSVVGTLMKHFDKCFEVNSYDYITVVKKKKKTKYFKTRNSKNFFYFL